MRKNASSIFHLAILAALLLPAATISSVAQTATTDPVGFITLSVKGGGSVASPKLSLLSPTLTQPITWQGAITGVSSSGGNTTITVSGSPWTDDQFNNGYYAEIVTVSPNTHATGALAVVSDTTTSSIIVTGNLTSPNVFAAVGDMVRIRKDMTIADVFGATNTAGLLATDDPSSADEVLIYDGASSVSYFYYTGSPGYPAGWYNSSLFTPAGDAVIGPHQGVVVKRKAAGAISFTSSGAVKTGNTLFPVVTGLNVLGTASAQGLTLGTSGLYTGNPATGVKPSDDPSSADEVTIYTASGQTNYFYYIGDTFGNPAGWYGSASFAPSDSVAMAPGAAFVLNRKGGVSFNWSLPSPTSF
jgi:uncharacterized protein (TIGR02597 family)